MRVRFLLSVVVLSGVIGALSFAQAIPDVKLVPSPPGQAAIQVGGKWDKTAEGGQTYRDGKWIVVDYGRPLLRGRKDIFGAGADYGKFVNAGAPVWRAGANDTTQLTTQVPLAIGGKTIAPGIYNVFVDLKPGNWTLVMSTQPVQEKFDLLRAPMSVRANDSSVEQFNIGFSNVSDAGATLYMAWEKTLAAIDIKFAAGSK